MLVSMFLGAARRRVGFSAHVRPAGHCVRPPPISAVTIHKIPSLKSPSTPQKALILVPKPTGLDPKPSFLASKLSTQGPQGPKPVDPPPRQLIALTPNELLYPNRRKPEAQRGTLECLSPRVYANPRRRLPKPYIHNVCVCIYVCVYACMCIYIYLLILSYLILSDLILSYLILSYLILSYIILNYIILYYIYVCTIFIFMYICTYVYIYIYMSPEPYQP